ncbi:DUF1801 domain-containing protein [Kineococcus indalonis]|uniref:DUF1801 domain-containing protein n=1 Tax=Kineococcus indalonis TaxID=2696566 RepID=UPI001412854F|nr:DUF1801 domain-containing protein [Kineococcus indalonis]NAZ84553.1 DUF1801 domain-containing protein [Kineococcus indalonis]
MPPEPDPPPPGGDAQFSEQERAALRERASELRRQARRGRGAARAAADEADVLATIERMPEPDRTAARRVHAIATSAGLAPRPYYGQPGYTRRGTVVCFFRSGRADAQRCSTLGFGPSATLDEPGGLWPTSYALLEPDDEAWARLGALVGRAATEAEAGERTGSAVPG